MLGEIETRSELKTIFQSQNWNFARRQIVSPALYSMFSAVAIRLSVKKFLENSRSGNSSNARLVVQRVKKIEIKIMLSNIMSLLNNFFQLQLLRIYQQQLFRFEQVNQFNNIFPQCLISRILYWLLIHLILFSIRLTCTS